MKEQNRNLAVKSDNKLTTDGSQHMEIVDRCVLVATVLDKKLA